MSLKAQEHPEHGPNFYDTDEDRDGSLLTTHEQLLGPVTTLRPQLYCTHPMDVKGLLMGL